MKRNCLALLLSAALCTALFAGCGGSETPATDPAPLRVLAGQSTTDAGIEDFIDEKLAEMYPEITLEWECVDWGNDFQPKMQVYMQSGLPDIMVGKAQDVATYGSMGLLADLTGKPYMDKVLDAAKEGVTLDGQVLGLTYNSLYQGVYYSRALFAEHGLTPPDTLDELQTIIDTLNAAGITPFATHMVDTWSIGNVTMQFAVNDVFVNNPTWGDDFRAGEVNFVDSPEYRAAYEYNKLIYDNTWSDQTFSNRGKGMIPGLWLEIEVVGINSPLVKRVSPDWFFQRNGRPIIDHSRYQLDFRNPQVREYADSVVDRLVNEYGVGYIKNDYNINAGVGTDREADSAGEGLLTHTRAFYMWLDGVLARYPDLVIENCGSGGMRMSSPLLERLSIQSVTDQTDYLKMAAIACNCMTACPPNRLRSGVTLYRAATWRRRPSTWSTPCCFVSTRAGTWRSLRTSDLPWCARGLPCIWKLSAS